MKQKHLQLIIDEINASNAQLSRIESTSVAMVKALADRMARIEEAQAEQLKSFTRIMDYLQIIKAAYKKHEADAFDRGQTASAIYGLIKRLDELEKRLLKEPA